jgi:hypothetical protein
MIDNSTGGGMRLFPNPNAETVAAMIDANDPAALKRYGSFRELCEEVLSDDL